MSKMVHLYALNYWDAERIVGFTRCGHGPWRSYDPLVIAAMAADVHPTCKNMVDSEVELTCGGYELLLKVWWKESNDQ